MANDCTQMRRKLVWHSTLYFGTGNLTEGRSSEWVTEPCGSPLFGDADKARGLCKACVSGWTHPNNYPVDPSTVE